MYTKVECVTLHCDNCQEQYQDDDSGFSIFVDEYQASDYVSNDGWYTEHEKHYCPLCHSYDDDDNLTINEKRKK